MSDILSKENFLLDGPALAEGAHSYDSATFEGFTMVPHQQAAVRQAMLSAFKVPGVHEVSRGLVNAGDIHTLEHELRVGELTAAVCIDMGVEADMAVNAAASGFVHDNHKDRLQHVIHQPRRLTDDEFCQIKTHPDEGAKRAAAAGLPAVVVEAVRNHHAYQPRPYGGDTQTQYDIHHRRPLTAGVVVGTALAAADVFDAARSARPEKSQPRSYDEAMAMVEQLRIPEAVKMSFRHLFERCGAVVISLAA